MLQYWGGKDKKKGNINNQFFVIQAKKNKKTKFDKL